MWVKEAVRPGCADTNATISVNCTINKFNYAIVSVKGPLGPFLGSSFQVLRLDGSLDFSVNALTTFLSCLILRISRFALAFVESKYSVSENFFFISLDSMIIRLVRFQSYSANMTKVVSRYFVY